LILSYFYEEKSKERLTTLGMIVLGDYIGYLASLTLPRCTLSRPLPEYLDTVTGHVIYSVFDPESERYFLGLEVGNGDDSQIFNPMSRISYNSRELNALGLEVGDTITLPYFAASTELLNVGHVSLEGKVEED